MTKHMRMIIVAVALAGSLGIGDVFAQAQAQAAQGSSEPSTTKSAVVRGFGLALQIQVVLSRYQGDKKISSMPYTLSLNSPQPPAIGRPSILRMNSRVPVPDATATGTAPKTRYQDIGTQIDCFATTLEDGRYELNVSIDDQSVYLDDQFLNGLSKASELPIIRSFKVNNQFVILRPGQSTQLTVATDRISGDLIRADVTLNVMKTP